jgi:hypothetical protein
MPGSLRCTEPGCEEAGLPCNTVFEQGEFVEATGPILCGQHASNHGYCAECGQPTDETYLKVGKHSIGMERPCRYCEECYRYGAWWT